MHIVICVGLVWSVSVRVYAVERDPSDPRMSDEKLSGVLQQLVSAGKPSFADIVSSKRLTVLCTVLDVKAIEN